MPEGHTIHRLALDHARDFGRDVLRVSSPQGRARGVAERVDGQRLVRVDAHGKHLLYRFEDGVVHVHLGLFGKFRRQKTPAAPPRDTVRLRLEGARWTADLTGPTACELLDRQEESALRARLGPDPLRDDGAPESFITALSKRRTPIGVALLDQRVLAGVGNVYRAEALFVLGIHPERASRDLDPEVARALWDTLARMLERGVRDRRIVTVDPAELGVPRRAVTRREATYVYRRAACLRCGTPVRRWQLGARVAYACEVCQPA